MPEPCGLHNQDGMPSGQEGGQQQGLIAHLPTRASFSSPSSSSCCSVAAVYQTGDGCVLSPLSPLVVPVIHPAIHPSVAGRLQQPARIHRLSCARARGLSRPLGRGPPQPPSHHTHLDLPTRTYLHCSIGHHHHCPLQQKVLAPTRACPSPAVASARRPLLQPTTSRLPEAVPARPGSVPHRHTARRPSQPSDTRTRPEVQHGVQQVSAGPGQRASV